MDRVVTRGDEGAAANRLSAPLPARKSVLIVFIASTALNVLIALVVC